MMEFLEKIKSDADLALLWRNILNADGENAEHAVLVFTDRLEEIGGWESEADFLRESVLFSRERLPDLPERLRFIESSYLGYRFRAQPTHYTVIYSQLTEKSFRALGINYTEQTDSTVPIAEVENLHGLPYSVYFRARDFPVILEWLRIFLHQLPIAKITTNIQEFVASFVYDQEFVTFFDYGDAVLSSESSRYVTLRLPERNCPDSTQQSGDRVYRLFRLPEDGQDEDAEDYNPFSAIVPRSNTFHKILFWLSHALKITVSAIGRDDITSKYSEGDYPDVDIKEALRLRADYGLLDR